MPEEWIVRVAGIEYGPVDLEQLREWKQEGRLIRENELRAPGSDRWIPAGEFPELFADEMVEPPPLPAIVPPSDLRTLLVRTWQIYRDRFAQFLGLSLLVIVPALCAQLSSAAVAGQTALDLRSALAGLFNLGMVMASFVVWPIYIAGLQILTSEASQGRSVTLSECVSRALKYWPRVAALCVLVYGAFVLLMLLAFAILLVVATAPPNILIVLAALGLLVFQVWMFGRVFGNVLFWQQAAVLEDADIVGSLRRSRELARGRRDLPWWSRPLWRGAVISSLWCLFATLLSIGPEWSALTNYYHILMTTQDPQGMMEAMSAAAKPGPLAFWALGLGVLQTLLRPLLGIAFVLLYLDLKN
ncbi:MAG: DUF4339 domain-containing protein [Chthoniobacterales bacterium]